MENKDLNTLFSDRGRSLKAYCINTSYNTHVCSCLLTAPSLPLMMDPTTETAVCTRDQPLGKVPRQTSLLVADKMAKAAPPTEVWFWGH